MKAYVNPYIIKLIEESINDESAEAMFFEHQAAGDKQNAALYGDIAADALKHKKMLCELYSDMTGKEYRPAVKEIPDMQGTAMPDREDLIKDKADKAAVYRTLYFTMPSSSRAERNMLFEIMTDEMMHLSMLSSVV